jgi:hypothetical protein
MSMLLCRVNASWMELELVGPRGNKIRKGGRSLIIENILCGLGVER